MLTPNGPTVPDVDLDLHLPVKRSGRSRIKVRCSATERHATAISEASQATNGIESSTITLMGQYVDNATAVVSELQDASKYLATVVEKLAVFLKVVDEVVKVRPKYYGILVILRAA